MNENNETLRILIIQPGYHRTDARGGNFTTALRWKRMLKAQGHRVRIDGEPPAKRFCTGAAQDAGSA